MNRRRLVAVLALVIVGTGVGVAACGDDTDERSNSGATSTPDGVTAPGTKVSANDATEDDLAAALEAARVANSAKWAHEVVEYRPYPEDDPTFAKLRQKLAKYNPGPGVVDTIVSVLQP
jgi:hypothetical protein